MDLESLEKVRSPVRKATTEYIKQLEQEVNKTEERSIDLIDEILVKLLDKHSQLKKLDSDVLNLCKAQDLTNEVDRQQEYRDQIITWKMRAVKILRKNESETLIDRNVKRNTQQCSVKLPRLQIPQYDGSILNFNDFSSQFEAAIHKNSNLSDVEKFNYLKSYLIKDTEIAIRGLALTSENYDLSLNILKERFARTDMIIDAHMSQLLNLNPVRKSQDVKSLRRLYSICETHIRGLENNGVDPNSYSSSLYPILLKSIPRDLSLEFSRKMYAKKENTISDLLEFLKIEIQCRERNEHLIKEFDADARKAPFTLYG
ncbi:hypothetical protein AVEN_70771-1 [Araneus ventricosus]|uniref:Uncharacterized protein n=1 Tax=Araneus ventricosus TaxID=182803 RepID=A0A4Y2H5M5_ARAVE|nr:hypothetical protein AVEN_70771-1 [Araneus ventricosus]